MAKAPPAVAKADRDRGARILYAHLLLSQLRDAHIPLAEFGALVAKAEGKDSAYSASTVSRWESGEAEPTSSTILAICKVCKNSVDPGWLMFGEAAKGVKPRTLDLSLESVAAARAGGRRGPRGA